VFNLHVICFILISYFIFYFVIANANAKKRGKRGKKATPVEAVYTEPKKRRRKKATPTGAATTGRKRRRSVRAMSSDDDNDGDDDSDDVYGSGLDDRYNALYADESDDEPAPPKKKRGRASKGNSPKASAAKKPKGRPRKSRNVSDSDDAADTPLQYMSNSRDYEGEQEVDEIDVYQEDDDVDPYATGGGGETML
jgi:hypothetical protein